MSGGASLTRASCGEQTPAGKALAEARAIYEELGASGRLAGLDHEMGVAAA